MARSGALCLSDIHGLHHSCTGTHRSTENGDGRARASLCACLPKSEGRAAHKGRSASGYCSIRRWWMGGHNTQPFTEYWRLPENTRNCCQITAHTEYDKAGQIVRKDCGAGSYLSVCFPPDLPQNRVNPNSPRYKYVSSEEDTLTYAYSVAHLYADMCTRTPGPCTQIFGGTIARLQSTVRSSISAVE